MNFRVEPVGVVNLVIFPTMSSPSQSETGCILGVHLVHTGPGTRDRVAADWDMISFLLWTPLLLLLKTLAFPKSLMVLSKVPNQVWVTHNGVRNLL
jgi:hypothetical protein